MEQLRGESPFIDTLVSLPRFRDVGLMKRGLRNIQDAESYREFLEFIEYPRTVLYYNVESDEEMIEEMKDLFYTMYHAVKHRSDFVLVLLSYAPPILGEMKKILKEQDFLTIPRYFNIDILRAVFEYYLPEKAQAYVAGTVEEYIIMTGNMMMLYFILEKRFRPSSRCLVLAVENGQRNVLSCLASHDMDMKDLCLLSIATKKRYLDIVNELINLGIDLDTSDATQAVVNCVHHNDIECLRLLLRCGVSITAGDCYPLYEAIRHNSSTKIIHLLLQYGSRTDYVDRSGKNAEYYVREYVFLLKDSEKKRQLMDLFESVSPS